jgi:hypothetical protein
VIDNSELITKNQQPQFEETINELHRELDNLKIHNITIIITTAPNKNLSNKYQFVLSSQPSGKPTIPTPLNPPAPANSPAPEFPYPVK